MILHQFSSDEVKKFIFIIVCVAYIIYIVNELYKIAKEQTILKAEYEVKLQEYFELRDKLINQDLEFSSRLQTDLNQIKINYDNMTVENKIVIDNFQLELDKYRAMIITHYNIFNL
jgi:hypothetical protein